MTRYTHFPLNEEIRSIGGYYKVLDEGVIDFEGEKILNALKGAHVETSCCGTGGMGLVSIPGFVVSWKSSESDDGYPISEVKHVTDTAGEDFAVQGFILCFGRQPGVAVDDKFHIVRGGVTDENSGRTRFVHGASFADVRRCGRTRNVR